MLYNSWFSLNLPLFGITLWVIHAHSSLRNKIYQPIRISSSSSFNWSVLELYLICDGRPGRFGWWSAVNKEGFLGLYIYFNTAISAIGQIIYSCYRVEAAKIVLFSSCPSYPRITTLNFLNYLFISTWIKLSISFLYSACFRFYRLWNPWQVYAFLLG